MQPVLTRAQMQAMDRDAIDRLGIPARVLMEVAGRAVADAVEPFARALGAEASVLCLAGPGHNGADALVAARVLHGFGFPVDAVLVGPREAPSPEFAAQRALAEALGVSVSIVDGESAPAEVRARLTHHPLVVDGLFGVGLDRPLDGWWRHVVEALEAAPATVIAVDLPSGVDADTGQPLGAAARADVTVCLQFAKRGLLLQPGRSRAGELRVVDIGIPGSRLPDVVGSTAGWLRDDTLVAALPPRDPNAHKGRFGHLLVVAGTPERPGSALLCARAALRSGAGLVTVAAEERTLDRLAPALVEVMGWSFGPSLTAAGLTAALAGRTAAAIGPSLPPDGSTRHALEEALSRCPVPVVLDAGALGALVGSDLGWIRARPAATLLTPHPGEAGRLLGLDAAAVQSDRVAAATALSERSGAVVVLKGATTVVAEPDGTIALSTRGNPGLATAGTGDVLTGILGALLGQGVEPGLAARAGVELHGLAGDRAAASLGMRAMTASDVVSHLAGAVPGVEE